MKKTAVCKTAINFFPPIALGNGISGNVSGEDVYGEEEGVGMATINTASAFLPFLKFAKFGSVGKGVASGAQYSVAFEMKLASSSYPGVYRGTHFLEANKALSAAMGADARFAAGISELGINIPRSSAGSILGKSPANWVWHHDIGAGVMQLVPKAQHTIGSPFWNTLHPGGFGGFSIWGR